MATALAATQRRQGNRLRLGRQGQERQDRARRDARRRRGRGRRRACAARASCVTQGQEAPHAAAARTIKQKDIAVFTRQLATMMKAGVPLLQSFDIVARGTRNPQLTRLLIDIKRRRRDRHQPVAGVPQAPAVLRRPVLQPGRGRRSRRYPGGAARPARDLQGKDPRDQEQDQVGAVLPDLGASWSRSSSLRSS